MSGIKWSGDRLIQRLRDREEELGGIVKRDENSDTYVLELKDISGVAVTPGAYLLPGDEYPSRDVATAEALHSPSVFIWHLIWMRAIVKREAEQALNDKWEEITTGTKTVLGKNTLLDKLRAHFDRLPLTEIQQILKIGTKTIEFTKLIIELIQSWTDDD